VIRQQDDAKLRHRSAQTQAELHPVEAARQLDVEDGDARAQLLGRGQRALAVAEHADDLEVRLLRERDP
jgi:hypothetical protein